MCFSQNYCFPDPLRLLFMTDLLAYFQEIMAECGGTYKAGFPHRLRFSFHADSLNQTKGRTMK